MRYGLCRQGRCASR